MTWVTDKEYILESIREMFSAEPEVASIVGIRDVFTEAGLSVKEEDIEEACEALVDLGDLQRAGRSGYEATVEYMEECGHEVER